jgi:hypothetical protein
MYSTHYSCQILIKLEFYQQIFKKKTPYFMKICPVGAELFHADRQTGRHDEANNRFA